MSREVFFVKLSLVPDPEKNPKGAVNSIYLSIGNIVSIYPEGTGSSILTSAGILYTVVDTMETIERKCSSYGTMKVMG